MVQALCRQNGTGPYSGSGSTKAKLARRSSSSPRPTFPRCPAASSSRPSAPAQQATTPIPISYRGVGAGRSCPRWAGRQSVATRRKYHGNDLPRPETQQTFGTSYWLGAAMGERGNEGLRVLICDDDRTCQTRSTRSILSSTTIYQASKVKGGKTAWRAKPLWTYSEWFTALQLS